MDKYSFQNNLYNTVYLDKRIIIKNKLCGKNDG